MKRKECEKMLECEWQGEKYPVHQAKNGMFYIEIQTDEGHRRLDVQVKPGGNWGLSINLNDIPLAQRVKYYRACLGYSLDDLGKATGINKQLIWAYEHDVRYPPEHNLKKLRDVLGPIPSNTLKEQK